MPDFISLTCPTCGGKLEITPDIERFVCGYCGNEHIVKRGGGIISLIPVAEDIKGIKTGVDKTAAELAISRLKKEMEEIKSDYIVNKRQKLSNILNKEEGVDIWGIDFLNKLARLKGKSKGAGIFNDNENAELIKSLSDEDITFSVMHWGGFWKPKYREKVEYIYNVLNDVTKLMEEKDEDLRQKEAEIEKMRQIVNS